ncbi:uncharacterized protein KLLA0_E16721g [Kluyveromyces lactis]|uniref:Palmitoyltransferase AKR1 n=1 Tax=Kluyveromyces lactis (strain ATCC 8585 / CBS 2359 / DSM 70799 / NBRC 1267 / NRRL Y-1140 / WM37) TaxID=284590 RepID=AKR1_KLULA|nr:uncharacterized protein KLLA0_E16721g [Kluyveromyces lactis]Q875M2.1 RecName: Full=Palmitoyltransferase AKR1; AltName: Full=Ankyrin repeat-containing protein AKR1 [Kluyveromyces lactis NRRL Y-1140]AAO32609.1 AKR1 [Kluyveromyces lactis]CAG99790.1 KLLA0E16721p [Kluyveromyces lactis]|eukprot:XP_454703.1 uncharacterized protein KLLA0_E16721g [Kluyveromyces lactis]
MTAEEVDKESDPAIEDVKSDYDAIELGNENENENEVVSLDSMKAVISRASSELKHENDQGEERDLGSVEKDPILERYHAACKQGDMKTLREMVESKVIDLSNDYDPKERVSGLHWACINNRLSAVKYLAGAGAEVNFKGGELDATPLHWASKSGLVYIVDELLKAGADPNITDSQGYNLLHTSVFSSNIMLVIYVLFFVVDGKEDVDQPDPHQRTALQWATYQADALTVENLLKFNADVKNADDAGFTALHWGTVKGSIPVMDLLIKHGSDFFQTTNDGKNCFTIGKELYSIGSLEASLYKNGFDKNGFPLPQYFSASTGKMLTFFLPWVLIPLVFYIFSKITFFIALLINTIVLVISGLVLSRLVVPSYLLSKRHPILNSPLLAGILSGTIAIAFFIWFTKISILTFTEKPVGNIIMLGFFIGLITLFIGLMKSDPGYIPGTVDHDKVRETIKELLSLGKFDAKHFCVHTWIRIPLRSKYDRDSACLISAFDHFCPWVYNQIGLLNHKLFYMFVVLLEISVWWFLPLMMEYFDELEDYLENRKGKHFGDCHFLGDEDLCFGLHHDTFNFLLLCWVIFQAFWVLCLIAVQTVQMLKGVTDYEFVQINKKLKSNGTTTEDIFSSTPPELMSEELIAELDAPALDPRQVPQRTCFTVCCTLLGLDKLVTMIKSVLRLKSDEPSSRSSHLSALARIPTDYGWKQNLKDFWLLPDTSSPLWRRILLPPKDSHALLNGMEVDYYTLYTLPNATEELV